MEKFLLKNMWKIIFLLWIIIFLTWLIPLINLPTWQIIEKIFWINQVKQIISTQYMFSTIWAIFAFWYWYKKYEREKEIEMITSFDIEFNTDKNINDIINQWLIFFLLKEKLYISSELWEIIDKKNIIILENNLYVSGEVSIIKSLFNISKLDINFYEKILNHLEKFEEYLEELYWKIDKNGIEIVDIKENEKELLEKVKNIIRILKENNK